MSFEPIEFEERISIEKKSHKSKILEFWEKDFSDENLAVIYKFLTEHNGRMSMKIGDLEKVTNKNLSEYPESILVSKGKYATTNCYITRWLVRHLLSKTDKYPIFNNMQVRLGKYENNIILDLIIK